MFCRHCGRENEDDVRHCDRCGEALFTAEAAPVAAAPPASGMAIASFVCSLVGLLMCLFIGQILGLVFGYKARREIRESGGRLAGREWATAGIIIGWVGIVIDALLIVFYIALFATIGF